MTHKYEINRRYPFEAIKDSVHSVPEGSKYYVWFSGRVGGPFISDGIFGRRDGATHFMFIEYPAVKHTGWMNRYPSGYAACHCTRDDADKYAGIDRIACIKIEWEDGEGL